MAYCSEDCRLEDEALHSTVCSDLANCISDYKWQVTRGWLKVIITGFHLLPGFQVTNCIATCRRDGGKHSN